MFSFCDTIHCHPPLLFSDILIVVSFLLVLEVDFTSSVDALSAQKEKADKLIEQLQQEVDARNSEITAMKEEEANQQEEKRLLLNEVQQLSEAVELLKDKDVNIARLEEELVVLTDEKVKLDQQLASAEDEIMHLKEANDQLQAASASPVVEGTPSLDTASILEDSPDAAVGSPSPDITPIPEAVAIVQQSTPLNLEPSSILSSMDAARSEELEKAKTELSEVQAELTRVTALNEKLKAKLRAHMKKAKSESVGEYDSSEIRADIEKARQDKLNSEKNIHELREELDEVVRRKDGVIGDLKTKVQQLLDEKSRDDVLAQKYEKLVAEKDDDISRVVEKADGEVQDLRERYQLLDEEMHTLERTLEQEKVEYVQELENTKDGYEKILSNKEAEVENLRRELDKAKVDTEHLQHMLQEAHQSLEELNKLKGNFDHIVSGLHEDLQQALDDKAAADQIAHEFRVQLKRSQSSIDQSTTEQRGIAVDSVEEERAQLKDKLQAAQEEATSLRELLDVVNKEKEDLERCLDMHKQKGKENTVEGKFTKAVVDSKDGQGTVEEELPTMFEDTQETSNDVVWLQSELKKASELNRKLKTTLKKKRSRARSDSKDDEMSNETRAELERTRAAKIDSDRHVAELRLELNNFVKEKDKIVTGLKFKMEQVLQEKERANSMIEQHEKQLLEKDSFVRDLTEQVQSLSLENEALNKSLEELTAINSDLQLTAQAKVDLESQQRYNQSLIGENTKRMSELERELENAKGKYLKEIEDLKQEHKDQLFVKQRESDEAILELRQINTDLQQNVQALGDKKDGIERELLQTKTELEQVRDLKQEHNDQLFAKQRESEEAILELRQINTDLQQNVQALGDKKDGIERELLQTKTELEQVVRDAYPVIEEKDQKIKNLVALMDTKQWEADETIAQLEGDERKLQEQIQELEVSSAKLKKQLEDIQSEMEEQMQEFQRRIDEKDIELREEKESHQKQVDDFEAKFQELFMRSEDSNSRLEKELAQANSEIDNLKSQLQVRRQEKQDIDRLKNNFDHIISGLREDLQQALDGKSAADEIAHEFQVQLENLRKSMPSVSREDDVSPLLQENKFSEILEAAQSEVADVRAALEITVKERDDLQDKVKDFELLLTENNTKEAISSGDINLKNAGKDNVEKVVQEVILQSSVDNQVSAYPAGEAEIELQNLKNEMQKVKSLNDKLKSKLRAVVKKKRVKSDSGDEDTSVREELQTELEKVRQEKLEREKACQELRVELDAFVRQKENIVNELKSKIDQLVTQNEKSDSFVEHLKQHIEQKDGQLQDLMNDLRALESDNDQAWKNVEDLRRENANLCGEIEDIVFQRNESDKECSQLKLEQEKLVEEYDSLLDKKSKTIVALENKFEDTTEKYKTEIRATRDQHDGIIFQIQSHADNLERERLSASREAEQLKGQLRELHKEREDINKLKVNFDHIVSSLREDLQHALEGKAAADQIAHEFQVQLKRLEKVSGKLETQYNDIAVDTSDMEGKKEELQEELEAALSEVDNLRDSLHAVNLEKQDLEKKIRILQADLQERQIPEVKIRQDEKDGEQEKVFYEALIQSPEPVQAPVRESEILLGSPPLQPISYDSASDSEDIQKVKDDLSKVQGELEKVKTVNERLKARLKTMIRKSKGAKSDAGEEGSGQELKDELNKTRQEKLESEKAVQQLRVELDEYVRGKERIISELKTRMQQQLMEKEETNSLVEKNEKLLLERDAEISSLTEELESLSEQYDKVNQNLVKAKEENQNLKALLEQLQLQKVKAERELQVGTEELERLLQGDKPLLEEKDQQIAGLEAELSSRKELFSAELASLKDRYDGVISEQQNHANNLEQALVSANAETEQLKSRLAALEQGREDIDKLRTNFDHIVSGLSDDLQRALEGKAAADEIAYEFQMKFKRLEKTSSSSDLEVEDVCVGTDEMEVHYSSGKEKEIEELQAMLDHLKEEKEELEQRVMGLDEIVQDREGKMELFVHLVILLPNNL